MKDLEAQLLYAAHLYPDSPVGVVKSYDWTCEKMWLVHWYTPEDLRSQHSSGEVRICMTAEEIEPLIIDQTHPIFLTHQLPSGWMSIDDQILQQDLIDELESISDDRVDSRQIRELAYRIIRMVRKS